MIHVKVKYKPMSSERLDEAAKTMADMIICYIQDRKNRKRKPKVKREKDKCPESVLRYLTQSEFEERRRKEISEDNKKRLLVEHDAKGREIIEVYREVVYE